MTVQTEINRQDFANGERALRKETTQHRPGDLPVRKRNGESGDPYPQRGSTGQLGHLFLVGVNLTPTSLHEQSSMSHSSDSSDQFDPAISHMVS